MHGCTRHEIYAAYIKYTTLNIVTWSQKNPLFYQKSLIFYMSTGKQWQVSGCSNRTFVCLKKPYILSAEPYQWSLNVWIHARCMVHIWRVPRWCVYLCFIAYMYVVFYYRLLLLTSLVLVLVYQCIYQ